MAADALPRIDAASFFAPAPRELPKAGPSDYSERLTKRIDAAGLNRAPSRSARDEAAPPRATSRQDAPSREPAADPASPLQTPDREAEKTTAPDEVQAADEAKVGSVEDATAESHESADASQEPAEVDESAVAEMVDANVGLPPWVSIEAPVEPEPVRSDSLGTAEPPGAMAGLLIGGELPGGTPVPAAEMPPATEATPPAGLAKALAAESAEVAAPQAASATVNVPGDPDGVSGAVAEGELAATPATVAAAAEMSFGGDAAVGDAAPKPASEVAVSSGTQTPSPEAAGGSSTPVEAHGGKAKKADQTSSVPIDPGPDKPAPANAAVETSQASQRPADLSGATDAGSAAPVEPATETAQPSVEASQTPDAAQPAEPAPVTGNTKPTSAGRAHRVEAAATASSSTPADGFVRDAASALRAAEGLDRPIRIRLTPPELGALRVQVSRQEGGVSAQFEVTTPAAQATLNEHLATLKESLGRAGVVVERIEVRLAEPPREEGRPGDRPDGQPQHQQQQQGRDGGRRQGQPPAVAVEAEAGAAPRRASPGAEAPSPAAATTTVADELDIQV